MEATRERKKLDVEMNHSTATVLKKMEESEKKDQIIANIQQMNSEFYCNICDKQYKNISEVGIHMMHI